MSNQIEVITIAADGTMSAMYSDDSILRKIPGSLAVERVTTIHYTEATPEARGWAVIPESWALQGKTALDVPAVLQGFSGYEEARAFEIAWVNLCNLGGVELTEDVTICKHLRNIHREVVQGQMYDLGSVCLISIHCAERIAKSTGLPRQYLATTVADIIDAAFAKLSH